MDLLSMSAPSHFPNLPESQLEIQIPGSYPFSKYGMGPATFSKKMKGFLGLGRWGTTLISAPPAHRVGLATDLESVAGRP